MATATLVAPQQVTRVVLSGAADALNEPWQDISIVRYPSRKAFLELVESYIVMAYIDMAYNAIAYIVMACIVMANIVLA